MSKLKLGFILLILAPVLLINLLINSMAILPEVTNIQTIDKKNEWISSSYVGYAWSRLTGFTNPDISKFQQVAPGDTDDGNLGGSSYAGLGLSKYVCSWLTVGASYEIYNNFSYQTYHVLVAPLTSFGSEIMNTNFVRSFGLVHQSVLGNLALNFPKEFEYNLRKIIMKPVVGVGAGIGISKMTNFQTLVLSSASHPNSQVNTLGFNNLNTGFAWYVNLGLGFRPKETAANFGFSYRYYVGGKFASSAEFILNDAVNEGTIVKLSPWTGMVKTNQLKLFLDFDF